jgi:hypothetical protein
LEGPVAGPEAGEKGVAGEKGPESPKYRDSGAARAVCRVGSCRKMGVAVKLMGSITKRENSFLAPLANENLQNR